MKKYALIGFFFVIFLGYSFFRHYCSLSWDFSAYVLNAKFLFGGGLYYETYRPPLVPVLLAPTVLIGTATNYLYICFVSILFFYSAIKLSDVLFESNWLEPDKFSYRFFFLFFSLSSYVVLFAFRSGSELLSLSLLHLFFAALLSNKMSGHWIALAFLTRFNLLIFFPLMLISTSIKRSIINVVIAFVVIFPYLLFNYLHYGNWFVGIIDSYTLNVVRRGYLEEPMTVEHFWTVGGYYWFFAFFGVMSIVSMFFVSKHQLFSRVKIAPLLVCLVATLVIYSFANTPMKLDRYLFNLSLPIAYFATIGVLSILTQQKQLKWVVVSLCTLWFIFSCATLAKDIYDHRHFDKPFKRAADDMKQISLTDYYIESPYWVPMHYLSSNVYPMSSKDFDDIINRNRAVLLFKGKAYQTIDAQFTKKDIQHLPVLYGTSDYVILGNKNNLMNKIEHDFPYITNHNQIIADRFKEIGLDNLVYQLCESITRDMSNWQTRGAK